MIRITKKREQELEHLQTMAHLAKGAFTYAAENYGDPKKAKEVQTAAVDATLMYTEIGDGLLKMHRKAKSVRDIERPQKPIIEKLVWGYVIGNTGALIMTCGPSNTQGTIEASPECLEGAIIDKAIPYKEGMEITRDIANKGRFKELANVIEELPEHYSL